MPSPAEALPPPRFETLHVSELKSANFGLDDFLTKRVTGCIVKGVYPPDVLARVIERLEQEPSPIRRFARDDDRDQSRGYAGCSHGLALTNAQEDLSLYFEVARQVREATPQLFEGVAPPETVLAEVFSALARRPARVAPAPDGQSYTPVTYRKLFPGANLSIHRGNEFHEWNTFRDMVTRIDPTDQLSFFMPMALPEKGGELEVYPVLFDQPQRTRMDSMPESQLAVINRSLRAIALRPQVGDLLIFDGGRYLHRVSQVQGGCRWTMGGFMAPSRDGSEILYWS